MSLKKIAKNAIREEFSNYDGVPKSPDVSKMLGTFLQIDKRLSNYANSVPDEPKVVAYTLGRMVKYLAIIQDNLEAITSVKDTDVSFADLIYLGLVGEAQQGTLKVRLLEAMITACVDHGITPPSAQATLVLSSTRAPYEIALSAGIQAITDVHGGAGQKAAEFFLSVVNKSKE